MRKLPLFFALIVNGKNIKLWNMIKQVRNVCIMIKKLIFEFIIGFYYDVLVPMDSIEQCRNCIMVDGKVRHDNKCPKYTKQVEIAFKMDNTCRYCTHYSATKIKHVKDCPKRINK
jgi:hypothetical protein